jgi:hypothetical protein
MRFLVELSLAEAETVSAEKERKGWDEICHFTKRSDDGGKSRRKVGQSRRIMGRLDPSLVLSASMYPIFDVKVRLAGKWNDGQIR